MSNIENRKNEKEKLKKDELKRQSLLIQQEYEQNGATLSDAIIEENGLYLLEFLSIEAVEIVRDVCNKILNDRAVNG